MEKETNIDNNRKKENPNERVAPYYNLSLEDEHKLKESDLERRLNNLELDLRFEKHNNDIVQIVSNLKLAYQGLTCGNNIEAYRNKNKFTFGYSSDVLDIHKLDPIPEISSLSENVKLGFIGGSHPTTYIVDCQEALTVNGKYKEICRMVEKLVQESSIPPFLGPARTKRDRKSKDRVKGKKVSLQHWGVWKYLTVRHSECFNMYMVTLTNFTKHFDKFDKSLHTSYEKTIKKINDGLIKVGVDIFAVQEYNQTLEPQHTDVYTLKGYNFESMIEKVKKCYQIDDVTKLVILQNIHNQAIDYQKGSLIEPMIYEKMMEKIFQIGYDSFFQVNTEATNLLYDEMKDMFKLDLDQDIKNKKFRILIDLYCGTGSIGISLSDAYNYLIGIDEVDTSIKDANKNAELNGVQKFCFLTQKCEKSIEWIENKVSEICFQHKLHTDDIEIYLIVDPSRAGLHKKVRQFLIHMFSKRKINGFIYCSCNVETWINDIVNLSLPKEKEYINNETYQLTPQRVKIFNLFPRTKHYEVVSSFVVC